MKPTLLALVLASSTILSAPALHADTVKLETKIDKVTVYRRSGADIFRTAPLNLPAGNHEIIVTELPISIEDAENIRALVNSSGVHITSVKTERKFKDNTPPPRQQEIIQAIESATAKLNTLLAAQETEKLKLDFVKRVGSETSDQKDSANEWQAKFAFISQTIPSIKTEMVRLEKEISDTRKNLETLRAELAREGSVREEYYETKIRLSAKEPVTTSLELVYKVEDASWGATLDARLNSAEKTVSLSLIGDLRQDSGEAWNDVTLALSTTRPNTGSLPNLQSQFLAFLELAPQAFARGSAKRSADVDAESLEEVVVTGSRLRRTQFDASFLLPERVSIPSDSEAQSLSIQNYLLQTDEIIVKASPRLYGSNAYIYARTDLEALETPLFYTAVNLSRDSSYLGRTGWPRLIPNTQTELPFGVDDQISLTHVELPPQDGETGFFSSKTVEQERYLITVVNNHTTDTKVEIYDRVPVSTNEDIKVTALKTATKPTEQDIDGKPGLVKWVKTLAPGEKWQIRHEYEIIYPEKKKITRQNRN